MYYKGNQRRYGRKLPLKPKRVRLSSAIPKELRVMYKLDREVEVIPTPEGVLLRNPEYRLVRVLKAVERK